MAAFNIDTTFDDREVRKMLKDLGRKMPRVAAKTLNKGAVSVRSVAVKEIAGATGIKQKAIRTNTYIQRATRSRLVSAVVAKGKAIPLIHSGARQTKKGVTAKTGRGRRLYKSAFITTMPSGHKGVFRRKSRKRLPIREMYGPSVPTAFVWRSIDAAMRATVRKRLPIIANQEIRFALSKYK